MDNNFPNNQNQEFDNGQVGQMNYGMPNAEQPQMGFGDPNTVQPQMGFGDVNTMQPQMNYGMPNPEQPQMNYGMPNPVQPQMNYDNPFGAQPQMGYGNPYGMQNGGKKPKKQKVKKPMTKGKIAGIVTASVLGVAAVVCGVIFIPRLFRSPKKTVINAFENTFGISTESHENDADDPYGIMDTLNEFYTSGGDMRLSVLLTPKADEGFSDEIGIVYNTSVNQAAKQFNCEVSLTGDGTEALGINLYGTEDISYLEFKNIVDGYFSFPNDLKQFVDAPIWAGADIFDADMLPASIDYFDNPMANIPDSQVSDINSGYVNAFEKLWDNVTVKKDGKKSIYVNDNKVKATKYKVTIDEEDIEKAVQNFLDGVIEAAQENPEMMEEYGMTADDLSMLFGQLSVSSLITGELSFDVYVKDDKVVKIEASDKITIMYVNLNYDFHLDIDDNDISGALDFSIPMAQTSLGIKFGVYDRNGDVNGLFEVTVEDDSIAFSFDSKKTEMQTETAHDINFALKENGDEVLDGVINIKTDSEKHSFEFGFEIGDDYERYGLQLAGSVSDFEKGKNFVITLDSLKLISDDVELVDVSASYGIDTTSNSAHTIDSSKPVYDLTTMTQQDFQMIMAENTEAINAWIDNLTQNTGALGALIVELFQGSEGPIDEPNEPVEPIEEPENYSFDDAILNYSDRIVQITGAPSGFHLDYVSDSYIELLTDNGSYIDYNIYLDCTPEEILESAFTSYIDYYEVYELAEKEKFTYNDEEYTYSMITCDVYGSKISHYIFVKQLDSGSILVASVIVEDDVDGYTYDDVVTCITDYVNVIQTVN